MGCEGNIQERVLRELQPWGCGAYTIGLWALTSHPFTHPHIEARHEPLPSVVLTVHGKSDGGY